MCGVFGAFSAAGNSVLEDVYLGLYALQHRGQESAGISWINGEENVHSLKGMGLVHIALDQKKLASIKAGFEIVHVRFSTTCESLLANAQPLAAKYARGPIAIAHNGNLTNADGIRRYLENRGAIFQSTTDTEVIIHLMAHQSHKPPLDALVDSLRRLRGAYSLSVMLGRRLIAARDPWGFRPLVLGERDDVTYVASETCALDIVGAKFIRDVEPGEIVVIDGTGIKSVRIPVKTKRHYACSFEYVYFARPDSVIDGRSVYKVRKALGERLAIGAPCPSADFITGMPDSGLLQPSGMQKQPKTFRDRGCPEPLRRKNFHTTHGPRQEPRSPNQAEPHKGLLKDKEVVVVDDSIVRGTTARRIVNMMSENGASAVHLRIASPPVRFPAIMVSIRRLAKNSPRPNSMCQA